jgi:Mn2+/Fe2+ NRAMP family transporter
MEAEGKTIATDQFDTRLRGYKVKSPRVRHFLTFSMLATSGLIVTEKDNDSGAVSTYAQAGAQCGYQNLV